MLLLLFITVMFSVRLFNNFIITQPKLKDHKYFFFHHLFYYLLESLNEYEALKKSVLELKFFYFLFSLLVDIYNSNAYFIIFVVVEMKAKRIYNTYKTILILKKHKLRTKTEKLKFRYGLINLARYYYYYFIISKVENIFD